MNCLLVNQFATPGLGSLMGGRYLAGTIQLLFALAGFGLFLIWFGRLMVATWNEAMEAPHEKPAKWQLVLGLVLFAISWFHAWFTSISLLREPRPIPQPDSNPPAIPPVSP